LEHKKNPTQIPHLRLHVPIVKHHLEARRELDLPRENVSRVARLKKYKTTAASTYVEDVDVADKIPLGLAVLDMVAETGSVVGAVRYIHGQHLALHIETSEGIYRPSVHAK
jgi:hypothetical protein